MFWKLDVDGASYKRNGLFSKLGFSAYQRLTTKSYPKFVFYCGSTIDCFASVSL